MERHSTEHAPLGSSNSPIHRSTNKIAGLPTPRTRQPHPSTGSNVPRTRMSNYPIRERYDEVEGLEVLSSALYGKSASSHRKSKPNAKNSDLQQRNPQRITSMRIYTRLLQQGLSSILPRPTNLRSLPCAILICSLARQKSEGALAICVWVMDQGQDIFAIISLSTREG